MDRFVDGHLVVYIVFSCVGGKHDCSSFLGIIVDEVRKDASATMQVGVLLLAQRNKPDNEAYPDVVLAQLYFLTPIRYAFTDEWNNTIH